MSRRKLKFGRRFAPWCEIQNDKLDVKVWGRGEVVFQYARDQRYVLMLWRSIGVGRPQRNTSGVWVLLCNGRIVRRKGFCGTSFVAPPLTWANGWMEKDQCEHN